VLEVNKGAVMSKNRKLLPAGLIAMLSLGLFSCKERQKNTDELIKGNFDKLDAKKSAQIIEEGNEIRRQRRLKEQEEAAEKDRPNPATIQLDGFRSTINRYVLWEEDEKIRQLIEQE
jgi:hypothetical protein